MSLAKSSSSDWLQARDCPPPPRSGPCWFKAGMVLQAVLHAHREMACDLSHPTGMSLGTFAGLALDSDAGHLCDQEALETKSPGRGRCSQGGWEAERQSWLQPHGASRSRDVPSTN